MVYPCKGCTEKDNCEKNKCKKLKAYKNLGVKISRKIEYGQKKV